MKIKLSQVDCKVVLSFLEALAKQNVSVHMLSNYVSAIKAYFSMYGLNYEMMEDPRIRYFLKSVRINRPLAVPKRNIMCIDVLKNLISLCSHIKMGVVYRAVFLTGFLAFFVCLIWLPTRLPPLIPQGISQLGMCFSLRNL